MAGVDEVMVLLLSRSEADRLARQQWQNPFVRDAPHTMSLNAQRTTAERFSPSATSCRSCD